MPGLHQRWALLLTLTLSLAILSLATLPSAAEAQTCSGYVGITFDDGPGGNTNALLTALRNNGVRATFFNIGQNAAANPSLVAAQVSSGGWVQNHSYTHQHMTSLSQSQMQSELSRTNQAIAAAGGGTPNVFRPPYGETNSTLQSVASGLGLRTVTWDVDSQDWNGASTANIVAAAGRLQNGQIILMHDGYASTNAAIPQIMSNLRTRGLCPGKIDPSTGRAVAPDGGGTTFDLTVTKSGTGSGTVAGGLINCGSTCSASIASGTAVTLTATPAAGSTFGGWGGSCTGTGSCVVTMTAARSVSATFNTSTGTTYALTVTRSGTGSGAVAGGPIDCGSTCSANVASGTAVTLTATPAAGSTFGGWSGACTGTGSCVVTMTAARSVTATFNGTPTGTVSINAGGSATGSWLADQYSSGGSTYSTTSAIDTSLIAGTVPPQAVFQTERYGEFTYTIPGRSGAQAVTLYFQESYWTAAGQRTFDVAIDGTTVLAAFDIYAAAGGARRAIARTFDTTANASGQVVIRFTRNGPDQPKICGITVAAGEIDPTTQILTVTRAGTGSGTVSGSGINCGTSCSASYATGTIVTLTAAPASGSSFAGWSGACAGTASCVVTMTAAQSVTATFDTTGGTSFPLTVTRAGTGTGTVTSSAAGIDCGTVCSANVAGGTTVTLAATPAAGSTFAGWSGACAGTGGCVVTMNAAQTVGAAFDTSGGTTPCTDPVTFTTNTGNFNTTGAVCYRTTNTVNGWGCVNFAGRTVSVNAGTATSTCSAGPFPLGKAADGYTYFAASAGTYPWASIYIW